MNFDTLTLLAVAGILGAVMSISMILMWRFVLRERPLLLWGIAQGCGVVGMVLLIQRGALPDFISIIVGNSLNFACYALIWWATCDYRRLPPPKKTLAIAFAIFLACLVYYTYFEANVPARMVIFLLLTPALLAGAAATLMMRRKSGQIRPAEIVAGLAFLLEAAFRLIVLGLLLTDPNAANPLPRNPVIGIGAMLAIIGFAAWGTAVIMMVLDGVVRRLARTENLLQTVLDAIPTRVFWKDGDSRYLGCNRHFARDAGLLSCASIIGKTDDDLTWGGRAQNHQMDDWQIITVGEPKLHYEERVILADGTHACINTSKVPLRDAQHKIIGMVGAYEDVTESKRNAEALERLNETLEERVKTEVAKNMAQERLMIQQSRLAAMGEMIGNLAHQWRQPINALTLLLGNIKDAYEYNELTQEYLDSEVNIGQTLIQIMSGAIDDFRNFFQPDMEKQRFIACDSVEEAIKLIGQSFKTSCIEIIPDMSVVNPNKELCAVFGYPNEFAQVVLNVLTNAKEAIIANKIPGKIHIKVEKGENTATVSLRDNGGGISEETLGSVFDPFFTTKETGAGIGLYMSKMIMNNMNGDISLQNTGDGVEARITLPLAAPSP